jgi:hypothetical protein
VGAKLVLTPTRILTPTLYLSCLSDDPVSKKSNLHFTRQKCIFSLTQRTVLFNSVSRFCDQLCYFAYTSVFGVHMYEPLYGMYEQNILVLQIGCVCVQPCSGEGWPIVKLACNFSQHRLLYKFTTCKLGKKCLKLITPSRIRIISFSSTRKSTNRHGDEQGMSRHEKWAPKNSRIKECKSEIIFILCAAHQVRKSILNLVDWNFYI